MASNTARALLLALMLIGLAAEARADTPAEWIRRAVASLCPLDHLDGLAAQEALPGSWFLTETREPATGEARRIRLRLVLPGAAEIEIERRQAGERLRQFIVAFFDAGEAGPPRPVMQGFADGGCMLRSGRAIRRDGPIWQYLDQLDGDLATLRWSEVLQAPWPPGEDPGGVRVALVDSGLAYDLAPFPDRLARGADGTPLGFDFWDMDAWPYDGDTARGPFLPIRHGTAVASVLAREAPDAALIPFRFPRPALERMGDLVEAAHAAGARILAMPIGSARRADWAAFEAAMRRHDMLAIVSAGNDGRDIDESPLWPASAPLATMIVVTSADAFGRLAEGSNWGGTSVDVMLPAENVPITDFRGASGTASGTSYAVPRLAALAARLLARDPSMTAVALKAAILARARPSPFERSGVTAAGWIPDPAAD